MFPQEGTTWSQLKRELNELKAMDFRAAEGRAPGLIHGFNEATYRVQRDAFELYAGENALSAGKAFPSVQLLLEDIYAMALDLFHGTHSACATFTSGGTESIFLAVKAARDYARAANSSIAPRQIVAATTAHPALDKAAQILDLEVIRVPLGKDRRADVGAMAEKINSNTLMLYGSAPCYPYGLYDSIIDLAELAKSRALWMHVDACWGGFLAPFMRDLGYENVPAFDLGVSGITTMSADLHKFGYAAKGASLLLFANRDMERYANFDFDWVRGRYLSPAFAGTRSAGPIAAAWAVLKYLGRTGYRTATQETLDATLALRAAVAQVGDFEVEPASVESNIFFFTSTREDLDIRAVAQDLKQQGWFVGQLSEPPAIIHTVSPIHGTVVDQYARCLREAKTRVIEGRKSSEFDSHSY